MRKALQAEQSKAEMLIKIQNIEEECADLEEEVDERKRQIERMLKDEKIDKETERERHEEIVNEATEENKKFMLELKKILTTFEERKQDD